MGRGSRADVLHCMLGCDTHGVEPGVEPCVVLGLADLCACLFVSYSTQVDRSTGDVMICVTRRGTNGFWV